MGEPFSLVFKRFNGHLAQGQVQLGGVGVFGFEAFLDDAGVARW
jgi:hypothetical protein